jgi:hypothetical protein
MSCFLILLARTHFRQYRWRRVPFSCFALPDSFSAVQKASVPVFMFCEPIIIFGGSKCLGSCFHVLCSEIHSKTRFRRYRGRRVPFSCFARPDSFSAVLMAAGPVFMLCASGLIFGGTEGVGSCFMFCAHGLIFCGTEGVRPRFHVLRSRTHFRRYQGRRVPFSCFALPDSFSAIPWASGPVFMFCPPGLIFNGTKGVPSCFHIFRSQTYFRRYRGCRDSFSCFALPDSFPAVSMASGPVFLFCASNSFSTV